jgi:peptidoglycan hydrolase-like protein with peptidoglycan-binding domain
MKKIAYLLVFIFLFTTACARKAEKAEIPQESDIVNETESIVSESQPSQAKSPAVQIPAVKDALTEQVPAAQLPVAPAVTTAKPTTENIQQALKNAGLYTGKVDGKLGPKTKKAIEAFQAQNNLTADGKVGPKTWEKLREYLNKPLQESAPPLTAQ